MHQFGPNPPHNAHPGIWSGTTNYYTPATILPGSSAAAVLANFVYYAPFFLPGAVVDRISFEATIGAGNARLGLYTNLSGIGYSTLLDTGTFDCSASQVHEQSFSAIVLPDEWVWGAVVFDSGLTVRQGTAANSQLLGTDSLGSSSRGRRAVLTFGAFPAIASVASLQNVGTVPIIGLRKS